MSCEKSQWPAQSRLVLGSSCCSQAGAAGWLCQAVGCICSITPILAYHYGLCNMGLMQAPSSGEGAALVSPSKPSCLVSQCQDPAKTRAASSSLTS